MNRFSFPSGSGLGDLRTSESWMEIGLALAAAAFSLVIWLAADSRPSVPGDATRVTFPTVIVKAPR